MREPRSGARSEPKSEAGSEPRTEAAREPRNQAERGARSEEGKIVVRVSRRYDAAPERVFDAWLDVEQARRWLFATPEGEIVVAEIDPRVGGRFRFTDRRGGEDWEHVGEYLEIDRPRRLVFRFGVLAIAPDLDRVTIEIEPRDGGGCELALTHEMDAKWAEYEEGSREAWDRMLDGVARSVGG